MLTITCMNKWQSFSPSDVQHERFIYTRTCEAFADVHVGVIAVHDAVMIFMEMNTDQSNHSCSRVFEQ